MPSSMKEVRRRLVGSPFAPNQIEAIRRALNPPLLARVQTQITLGGTALDATAVRSDLTLELDGGQLFAIEMCLIGSVAVTAGLQFDFNGGNTDVTTFRGFSLFIVTAAPVPGAAISTALNTAQSNAAAGQGAIFKGFLQTGAAGGLLIPRINRAGAGTTTIDAGSYISATPL